MLRFVEAALFLAPFVAFGLWWMTAARGGPPPRTLIALGLGLLLLAVGLVWFAGVDSLGRRDTYVPARVEDGRLIPGHAARP